MTESFLQDYDFVVDAIQNTHPLAPNGFPAAYTAQIEAYRKNIKDKTTLIHALSKLTASLQDAHTNIELPFTETNHALNIPCRWYENSLYVIADYESLMCGDKIVSINGVALQYYYDKLAVFIPHENLYLLKSRTTQYPYQNYYLFSALNLQNQFGEDISVYSLGFKRQGSFLQAEIPLQSYNGCCDFFDTEQFLSLHIVNDIAFIKFDECKFTQDYIDYLGACFKEIAKQNIRKLVLDLSDNMGGNSNVTQEFIRHIDIERYYFYEVSVREKNVAKMLVKRDRPIENDRYVDALFSGEVYCLVSNTTFSSARIFAVVLQDNQIAKIIGENSGGKPTSFGAPTKFATPHCGIPFRVSARTFLRPDSAKDAESSLIPDFKIPRTFETREFSTYYRQIVKLIR